MHELSIASGIVEAVLDFAEANDVRKVLTVRMSIGELTCVEADQLKFCFEAISKDSALEGATLEIESVPAAVRCSHCAFEGPPKYWDGGLAAAVLPTLQCPYCRHAAEPISGRECAIKSVKFVRNSESIHSQLATA
jgi:hydrogenase nickel incorporation protein HypA/HybF